VLPDGKNFSIQALFFLNDFSLAFLFLIRHFTLQVFEKRMDL
jgi:hypothetical protein